MWSLVIAAAAVMSSANSWGQPSQPKSNTEEKAAVSEAAAKPPADQPAAKAEEKPAAPPESADAKAAAATGPTSPAADATPPAKADKSTPAAKNSTPAKAAEAMPQNETNSGVTNAPPKSEAPADTGPVSSPPKNETTSLPAGATEQSIANKAVQTTGAASQPNSGWSMWLLVIILLVLFIVPIMIGNYLGRIWKMPDHAWKISLTLGILAGSILVCVFGQFKFGPDLAGGITLIYELQEAPSAANAEQSQKSNAPSATKEIRSGGREFTMSKLIGSLKKRLDPDGTKEITIREYGPAVEIIIPQVGQDEMEFVKDKITKMGQLEFRITADPTIIKDKNKIEAAKLVPPTEQNVVQGDQLVAKWVPYDVNEFGPVDSQNGYVKRMAGDTPEILVLIDPYSVTGEYLTSASKGLDERGGPAVHFSFNSAGAQRFERLTGQNLPNPATPDVYRRLGILLDGKLVNAPTIRSTISDRGMISGGSMTDRDVELTVQVLDAGSLPAALNKTPISQEIISPTLGGQTVEQGKRAIIASLIGVVVFMLVYYRFAGIVACIALTLNMLMVLALMVLIKAAFTLPGLAGLALTVGMSVDANVLIYERIREELESGAALRMAIRNGFGRAMSAIVDSNLTTIISGIVLFYIGTDQVKGFAVTLVLGILTSMFTAIFVARLLFDIAERRGWVKQLRMMHIFSKPNFDFLRIRWLMIGASWGLIAIGMVAVYFRGTSLFDIDFTGGSSVTFTLNQKDQMTLPEVRHALVQTDLADKNLLVVERGDSHTSFTIDTSDQSVENVKDVIQKEFGQKLKRYSFEFRDVKTVSNPDFAGTEAKVQVNAGLGYEDDKGMTHDALHDQIVAALSQQGHPGLTVTVTNPDYHTGSGVRYADWTVRVAGLDEVATKAALQQVQSSLQNTALFPLANTIGGRVSTNTQFQALLATAISIVAMIIYLWLRFQKPAYGIAAGVALIHDVLMTIGMIALQRLCCERRSYRSRRAENRCVPNQFDDRRRAADDHRILGE